MFIEHLLCTRNMLDAAGLTGAIPGLGPSTYVVMGPLGGSSTHSRLTTSPAQARQASREEEGMVPAVSLQPHPAARGGFAPHPACQMQLALLIITARVAPALASSSELKGAAEVVSLQI